MSAEKSITPEQVRSVTITLREEVRRREELQAIRRELLALARQDELIKKEAKANQEKHIALADRVLALINN
jgi:hypothetical protein